MRKRNPNFKIPSSDTPQDSLSALKLGVIVGLYETYPKFKNYNQKYIFERLDYIEEIYEKLGLKKDITLNELSKYIMSSSGLTRLSSGKYGNKSIYDTFELGKLYGTRKALKDILLERKDLFLKIETVEMLIEKFKYDRSLPNITLLELL